MTEHYSGRGTNRPSDARYVAIRSEIPGWRCPDCEHIARTKNGLSQHAAKAHGRPSARDVDREKNK